MKSEAPRGKADDMLLSAVTIGFGALTFPYSAMLGTGCMIGGIGLMAMDLYEPISSLFKKKGDYYEEIEKIIKIIQINSICNKEGEPLTIEKVSVCSSGLQLELNIPLGLSYKDLDYVFIPPLKAAFNDKEVTRERNIINIKFTELKESYELCFPPISKNLRNRLITYIGNSIDELVKVDFSQAGGILLAGQTGSGKSTLLRYMLTHIATNYDESEINLYLNDMKFCELMLFKDLKITKWHNTDPERVIESLEDFWAEVRRRYKLFLDNGCTDAYEYEALTGNKLPINLMVIEEFTILSSKKYKDAIEILNDILSQCRASKSHVIITTQRPDAKTLDPRLKANITHTIGLKTKSIINSNIICDEDVLKYCRGNGHGYLFDNRGRIEFQGFELDPNEAKKILAPYNKCQGVVMDSRDNFVVETKYKVIEEDDGDEF